METSQLSVELSELRAEVSHLKQLVSSRRCPSHSCSTSPAPSHPQAQPQPGVCWYHQQFGEAARKCKPPCSKLGNSGQPLAVTGVAGLLPSRLFYIIDHSFNFNFLVDTGVKVSVIPPTRADWQNQQDGLTLQSINNTSIATFGKP